MTATPPASLERKAFFILLLALSLAGLYILTPFLKTVTLGAAFTILFYPLHKKYLKWTRGRANLSSFFSVLSVFCLLILPIGGVFTLFTTQLKSLIRLFTGAIREGTMVELIDRLEQRFAYQTDRLQLVGFDIDLIPLLEKTMGRVAEAIAQYSPHLLGDSLSFILHLFIMLIVLFYLFREGPGFFKTMVRVTPVKDQYEHLLANEIKKTVNGVFYGSFLTALIQAVLATLGFYFIGIDGFLVWGALTFFMSFIPFIGTGAVLLPLIILLLIKGESTKAIILSIYGVGVIGLVDNLLKPILIRSNVHPLILFLSIFGGLAAFGPTGLLFGPMIFAMLTAILRIYDKDFQPTTTHEILPP